MEQDLENKVNQLSEKMDAIIQLGVKIAELLMRHELILQQNAQLTQKQFEELRDQKIVENRK